MFDNEVRSYLTDEDRQEIAEEFYAKGIEQGRKAERLKTVKALKDIGTPMNIISKVTGLPQKEIAKL